MPAKTTARQAIAAAQRAKAIAVRQQRQARRDPVLAAVIDERDQLVNRVLALEEKIAELQAQLAEAAKPATEEPKGKAKK